MTALQALIGFALWTFALVVGVLLLRGVRILGGTPINAWPRGAAPAGEPPFAKRLSDAHANCLENLPLFAVAVLVATASGRLGAIDAAAPFVFYARIGQTLAHLSGTQPLQVLVRATFWCVQLAAFGWMFWRLLA